MVRNGFSLLNNRTAFLLAMVLCFSLSVFAQDELYTKGFPGDSLTVGRSLTTQDTVFFNAALKSTISSTKSVNDIVQFSINEFSNIVLPDSFKVTLTVRLIYVNGSSLTDSISSQALIINYNKTKTYGSKAILSFQNAYKVQVKILSIAVQYTTLNAILPALQLQNDIDVNRSYTMDCINNAIQSISTNTTTVASNGELTVSWTPSQPDQFYDLEWAWVDQSALSAGFYSTNGQPDPALIFRNNASRVTIAGSSYAIPLLYDGNGSLFFRVRGTQTDPTGEIKATSWSSDFVSSGGLGRYDFNGHERRLNWQASTSFAEGGKRKSVVQYFDGSLRARQTVTKDNTTNTTVVAETFYDKQGRPAIQVLPAPTLSTLIHYTPLFNVSNLNGAEYDKSLYDTVQSASDFCSAVVPAMGTASGASQYYSPANPLVLQGNNQYIPDAHGYAFSQTQYTEDNTGRIYRQGGVDNNFQIGLGHETKYFYGSPEQNDLDALFGTEAGDASHYQKNMVRDANGQYSVSYVDMNGKTVATALAGTSPASLQQLPSWRGATQTDNLISSGNNLINGTSIQSTKSLLVTMAGANSFVYKMAAESLTIQDCQQRNICYDCLYDLNITITDNCNNQLLGGQPIHITKQNFQLFKVDTTCNMVIPMDTSFNIYLLEGEYNITKTLSISHYGMQYYHDSLFMAHNTCRTYQDFFTEQMDSIKARFDCNQPDDTTADYTSYREQMLQDLIPTSGQYADTSATIDYLGMPYPNSGFSIFNNLGSSGAPSYKYQFPTSPYLDDYGNPDSVMNTQGILVPPQQLSKDEFVANFRDSWANALLDKHPEYCLLKNYETLLTSLKWDYDFQKTDTYADALAKGYLNPTGNISQLPASRYGVKNQDPLYAYTMTDLANNKQVGTEALQAIQASLFSYPVPSGLGGTINQWSLATIMARCQDPSSTSCYLVYSGTQNAFNTDSLCVGELDMAWRIFRGLYEDEKAKWITQFIKSQCGNPQIYPPYIAVFQPPQSVMANLGYSSDGANPSKDSAQGQQNMANYFANTCTGYATAWWDQLAPCSYTYQDSLIIVPRLIRVCELGSDSQHPLGSSSINPDSSNRFTSFEDVVRQYNDSAYGNQKNSASCNAYLITNPLPYNGSSLLVNEPLWTSPSACECTNINSLYAQYLGNTTSYTSFSDYIQKTLSTSMTDGALDSLRGLCNKTIPCKYIPAPINLPPALQCNVGTVCAGCTRIQQWYQAFQTDFPGQIPVMLEPDTVQRNTNMLFAHYMNYQSGFSYSAQDYLTFMDTCSASGEGIGCSSSTWTVFNPGTGLSVNADLFMNANDDLLPVTQFFSDSYFLGPVVQLTNDYVLVDKMDSIQTADSVVLMQWRVKPANPGDLINPVIETGNDTYVGAEWIQDPADTSWLIGTTVIHVNGGGLKGPGLQSNSHGMLADWVKITSGSTAAVLFYDDFRQGPNCGDGTQVGALTLCGRSEPVNIPIDNVQVSPCVDTSAFAVSTATQIYSAYTDSLSDSFNEAYTSKCLNAINLESFTVTHNVSEYHYTLYYYDQAGNLVKTIPPEGVHPNRDPVWLSQIAAQRLSGTVMTPSHTLPTVYRYNSLNQVVSQLTPDAGVSSFWYDRLGRLAISQNAKQVTANNYSYTLYDIIGRITEVGQKLQPTAMTNLTSRSPSALGGWLNFNNASFTYNAVQVTSTVYDVISPVVPLMAPAVPTNPVTFTQQAYTMRNRVSYTQYYDVLTNNTSVSGGVTTYKPIYSNYTTGTYYSYDIHGNVDTLLQDYRVGMMTNHKFNRFKTVAYKYDLISGKVNEVDYNPGVTDQFFHRYEYDAENRITDVYTTDNKAAVGHPDLEEHEAFYSYYKHGPLARTVIGQQEVQGLDYAYTLQGWLKGVNSSSINSANDMGGDASATSPNHWVAQDAYGFNLNYFTGDYANINTAVLPFPGYSALMSPADYKPLFNGNISSMLTNIGKLNQPLLYNYQYDQLNRLVGMDAFTGLNQSTNTYSSLTKINDYQERVGYDANGNIKSYLRNGTTTGGTPIGMDNLTYNYNLDGNGQLQNNQLTSINDAVPSGNYANDIDQQVAGNYQYDQIGNLMHDDASNLQTITWTVYGKISTITKKDNSTIVYTYDASGNRISKTVTPATGAVSTDWYARDASGTIMAVYNLTGTATLNQTEQDLFGSSRLGVFNRAINMDAAAPAGTTANLIGKYFSTGLIRGFKSYELSNHLGNVLATISDRKLAHLTGGVVDYYQADVVSANDYYPFGMLQPGRQFTGLGSNYRFGFNGKENDKDAKNGYQNYGQREYDELPGRFISVDPIASKYPELTPYQFASNRPIDGIDQDGLEYMKSIPKFEYTGSWSDYPGAIDNGVANVLNIVPTLWNSGVSSIKSLNRGSYLKDLGGEIKQTGSVIKDYTVNTWNYTWNTSLNQQFADSWQTLKDPHTLESVVTILAGSEIKVPNSGTVIRFTASAVEKVAGTWVTESTVGWSERALAYQEYVTGVKAGSAFEVNGVRFDGIRKNTLLEAKSSYDNFVNKKSGEFYSWFKGKNSLVSQALRQIKQAQGASIEWNFATKKTFDATKKLFEQNNIKGITLKYNPIQ